MWNQCIQDIKSISKSVINTNGGTIQFHTDREQIIDNALQYKIIMFHFTGRERVEHERGIGQPYSHISIDSSTKLNRALSFFYSRVPIGGEPQTIVRIIQVSWFTCESHVFFFFFGGDFLCCGGEVYSTW